MTLADPHSFSLCLVHMLQHQNDIFNDMVCHVIFVDLSGPFSFWIPVLFAVSSSGSSAKKCAHGAVCASIVSNVTPYRSCVVRIRSPDSESAACASRVEKPDPTGDDHKPRQ